MPDIEEDETTPEGRARASDEGFVPAGESAGPGELAYREPGAQRGRTRRRWSAREEPPDVEGVQEWDFHALLSTFQVNWRAAAPYFALGRINRRALLINWSVEDLRSVEEASRMYNDIARRCPGPAPVDAEGRPLPGCLVCPCEHRHGADPEVWRGLPCPAENLQVLRHFVQLIRDLEVRPEDHVDVMQVVEIVKLMVYEGRCDLDLQDEGRLFDLQAGQIHQPTGQVYYNKVTPVALMTQQGLAARRQKILKELLATREARAEARRKEMKAQAALGTAATQATAVTLMTRLNRRNIEQRHTIQIESARVRPDDVDVIEGEPDVPESPERGPAPAERRLPAPRGPAVELTADVELGPDPVESHGGESDPRAGGVDDSPSLSDIEE